MNKRSGERAMLLVLALLLSVLGGMLSAMLLIYPDLVAKESAQKLIFFGGLTILGLGLVLLVISCVKISLAIQSRRASKEALQKMQTENARKQGSQRYIPADSTHAPVLLGEKQPIEDKFAEIAKMDKTQFVVYVAKLFSNKGYNVKFTPVLDNFGVDLIVTRGEKVIGVSCILSQKVLCEQDVAFVAESRKFYHLEGTMALTNTFFDRSALEFARKEKISLVDRNLLVEDFMR
ncbi:MAG: restriction endonuclease [Candidatus Fimimonas sp.]